MTGGRSRSRASRGIPLLVLLLGAVPFPASAGPWPSSSREPVLPLAHATLEERCRLTGTDPDSGYRFGVFGDQRAVPDGEWQSLMGQVERLATADPRVLFLVDTGDIVQNGSHTDQFHRLEKILAPVAFLPYWAAAGNHEVHNNRNPSARTHLAEFLSAVDSTLNPQRLYYTKRVGPVLFVFLDTNDFVYGPDGRSGSFEAAPGSRAAAQLGWLEATLSPLTSPTEGSPAAVIAVLHHPFIQSSEKHREQARELWDFRYHGRTLPDILVEGGVDLVLCGHTHTYERFRLRRQDGKELVLVSLSGRPKSSWWPFAADRRAEDVRGKEAETFREWGWRSLGMWSITQEDVMLGAGRNQCGLVTVGPDGTLEFEVAFLDPGAPEGLERTLPVVISRPAPAGPAPVPGGR